MTTNTFLKPFAALILSAAALAACSDDPDPVPSKPVAPDEWTQRQTVENDGTRFSVRSVVVETIDGMDCLFLSADAGVTSGSSLLAGDGEYALLAFGEETFPEHGEVDLATLTTPFRVCHMKGGKTLFEVTDRTRETLKKGSVDLVFDEATEKTTVDFRIVFLSGGWLYGNASWATGGDDPELLDAYEWGGVETPIRSAFETRIGGMPYLFLSPEAGITDYNDLLGSDREYVMMAFEKGFSEGKTDLMTLDETFAIYYMKGGEALLEVTADDRSAIVRGVLEYMRADGASRATLDFDLELAGSHDLFRGNASWDAVPGPDPDGNMVVIDGKGSIRMLSVVAENYADYVMITMSPVAGASSFEEIMDMEADYLQVLVSPSLLGASFDLMTETDTFTVTCLLDGMDVQAADTYRDDLRSGTCLFAIEGDKASVSLDMTLTDGTKVMAQARCAAPQVVINENEFIRNGQKKPLRAAFYELDDDGTAMLWFTHADIEYFEDIQLAPYYLMMIVGPEALDGNPVDIVSSDKTFTVIFMDNQTEEMTIVETGEPGSSTGTFSVAQSGSDEAKFKVDLDIDFAGEESVQLTFDGVCTPSSDEPEVLNELVFNDFTSPLKSAVIDMRGGSTVELWLCGAAGIDTVEDMQDYSPLHIVLPSECLDGDPAGFSVYHDLLVEYAGNTFSYDNGNVGTVTALLEGTALTLDFTTYEAGLKGHYAGETTVIR